jgi:hypothetical protein
LGRIDLGANVRLGLQTVTFEKAVDRFSFPMGTPVPWVAYKSHPLDPSLQVPIAQFHDFMLRDKKAEFLRIASALGARSIRMVDAKASNSKTNAEARVGTPEGQLGAGFGEDSATDESFSLDFGSDSPPQREPYIPSSVRWLYGEPIWQAMIDTRLEDWATRIGVSFRYTSTYGLTANMAAGLEGLGISLGGAYEEQHSVDKEYVVEFWPREQYGVIE